MAVLACGALVLPPAGWAASGGAGFGLGSSGGSTGALNAGSRRPAPVAQGATATISASGDGVTLQTRESGILSTAQTFTGTVSPVAAGETVEIERSGHETDWQWAPTVAATVGADGSFTAVWQTDHIGRFAIRAVLGASSSALASSTALAQPANSTPALTITVYRPSLATQYGPGFYGQRTACGQRLTRSMIGVANRTLACGELVAIYYHGRSLTVPVIDRGPYANGADWDLTEATGRALGITGTAMIAAVSLPNR